MIYIENEIYTINGKQQELPGFDEKYVNFVDYILKITDEIWHDRAIWVIHETYTKDVLIHAGANEVVGVESVVKGTLETLASFPDRHMGAEAVIWSEDGADKFFSSHRIFSEATNLSATAYGAATGKKVYFRTIADCAVQDNKIYEEWLVRDNLHLVQQLGFDPVEMAKRDQRYKNGKAKSPQNTLAIAPNETAHLLEESAEAALIFGLFEKVWQKRAFDQLESYYQPLATVHAVCDEDLIGYQQIKNYFEQLSNAFPEGRVIVERISCNKRAKDAEVACRWKIVGTHTGQGFFGSPSGQEVVLPIISHYLIEDGKINKEWLVFDGFDALCQIYANETATASMTQTDATNQALANKKMVLAFVAAMNEASAAQQSFTPIFKQYFSEDLVLNITKPFEEIRGIEGYEAEFWTPLMQAFPDLENQL
ncbi:MAG: ester cyclase, partial [Bacteroidota bacterium]